MSSTNDLPSRWRDLLASESTAKQEVDSTHPLRLLFGADDLRRPLFAIMSRAKPTEPDLPGDVIDAVVNRRSDGFYALVLSLKDQTLFDVFAQLCADLALRSRPAGDEHRALHEVFAALGEWKRLLRSRQEHMSLESLRGLVGELWCGWAQLAEERPIEEVFSRWCGPFEAHQDFQFSDGHWVEVKAVRPGIAWVEIASEFQLEPYGHQLSLCVVELDDAQRDGESVVSLRTLLNKIRGELALTPLAAQAFETALREFRDPFTNPFYDERWFAVRSCRFYEVSEGFPRLIPSVLPTGVSRVGYRLALDAIAPFAVDD